MTTNLIVRSFKDKVAESIRLESEGIDRFRVFTPFLFPDGDHFAIVLKQAEDGWILTDEGHTYMHLTYDLDERDLLKGTRQQLIANALTAFSIEDRQGELQVRVPDERFGDALYSFIQALMKISDVKYLTRERVYSTFMEDFRSLLSDTVPESRLTFDWHDSTRDPEGKYTVDCRINGMPKPVFVYGMLNDSKVKDVTISLLQFERWSLECHSVGIYENQEEVNRKAVARLSDICERQFSSLTGAKERIEKHLVALLRKV